MPIEKPNLNYAQLGLGGAFEDLLDEEENALSQQERAIRSQVARDTLVLLIKDKERWSGEHREVVLPEDGSLPKWLDLYLRLMGEGWPWRKAAYMAWEASPRLNRWPKTQEELATQFLGLTSDRVISKWKKDTPNMEIVVAAMQAAPIFMYRADILDAMIQVAATPDYKSVPAQKALLEMTRDYVPITQLNTLQMQGKLNPKNDIKDLSTEELIALSKGDFSVLGGLQSAGETEETSEEAEG